MLFNPEDNLIYTYANKREFEIMKDFILKNYKNIDKKWIRTIPKRLTEF